jgi:EAL domain-containing protein (putative c-di-GMP-specific phosphodiesterase class I)
MGLQSGRLLGFEALARWQHPTRGMLLPGEFIGIAEETGLISEIGDWSMREACRQLAIWQHQRPAMPDLFMSVNISAPQLTQPDLAHKIAQILQSAGIAAHQLKLEIVESALVAEGDTVISVCRQLKALGVQLSIDDFGTGYSSLSYLHRFPLDTVKIDRSFISQLSVGGEHAKIVTAIIALGRALGLQIIAEGIETHDQLTQLRAFDCDCGQGWLFARALTPAQAEVMIATSEVGLSLGACA